MSDQTELEMDAGQCFMKLATGGKGRQEEKKLSEH